MKMRKKRTRSLRYTYCSIEYAEGDMIDFINRNLLEEADSSVLGGHYDDAFLREAHECSLVESNAWEGRVGEFCKSEHEILHYYALFAIEKVYFSLAYQKEYLATYVYYDEGDLLTFDFVESPYPLKRVLVIIILLFQKYSLQRFKARWVIYHRRQKECNRILHDLCGFSRHDLFLLRLPHEVLRDRIIFPYLC